MTCDQLNGECSACIQKSLYGPPVLYYAVQNALTLNVTSLENG
ncbi:hypothetical protein MAR_032036 [Mya arenaria]|uniref:Uncharacterized protein n=1 Tax=Mya arenaria TaxID=6604 RepID=A0ABY7F8U6_MYAAR|nr:hypothetical protein MAR_032036 [Mya arenaria]